MKTEVFETKSISTQSIEQVFSKNGWRKSYTDIQERSRIKRMNQICTLILAEAVSHHDFNGKNKNISRNKDIAIACVVIMNDVQFKLEQYFGINLESLDVDDHSNTIIESNEDDTEFETSNVMTHTEPVQLESIASCATILKILTNKSIMKYVKKSTLVC